MALAVIVLCGLGLQQLQVTPFPAFVGQEVTVRAHRADVGLGGVALAVEVLGAAATPCGTTASDGVLHFVPTQSGQHVFVATIDGVRTLALLAVVAAEVRWPLALGSVPLGLALLWWNLSRSRGRRAP